MPPYKVLVSIEILRVERISRQNREKILSFLDSLAGNPHQSGDFEEYDDLRRPVRIKIIGDYSLTFWADHAVKEIKVVKVEAADRR